MQRGRMLQNNDVVSIQKDLMTGDYQQLLSGLRRIGRPIKQTWLKSSAAKNSKKSKFTSNPVFKQFLIEGIDEFKIPESSNISQLKNQLSRLALFLMVWKDDPNLAQESEQLNLSETEKKKLRQQIKFKSSLDKDDRYAINIALQTMVFILCQQSNNLIKHQETLHNYDKDFAWENNVNFFKILNTKQNLIKYISAHIKKLNKFESHRYVNVINYELSFNEKQQEIKKIVEAIAAFQTSNKKKKLLKYFGIFIAVIAALACGLSTGADIFLFISNFPVAITIGVLFFSFGFYANFNFFSVNFPDFLLSLFKKGGISEYIDLEGKRRQFSAIYKFLLALVVVASIMVGAGTTALTFATILSAIATILAGVTISNIATAIPTIIAAVAIIWPPLPLIIIGVIGVLAVMVGITLTIAVLTASNGSLKKIAALNLTFIELVKYAWNNCKEWVKNFKNLKTHQKVGYAITILLLPIALFGLAYFRYTAGADLAEFISVIGAAVTGVISYIAQMAFTALAVNKLSNILIKPFSSSATQQEASSTPKSIFSQVKSNVIYPVCLIGNAGANAMLVYNGSALSGAGAAACGLNSLAGNTSEPDTNRPFRNSATNALVTELENFDKNTRGDAFASTSDANQEKPENSKPNIKNLSTSFYPQEPENINLPSPTRSEDGLITMTSSDKDMYRAGPSFFSEMVKVNPAKNFDNRNVRVAAAH
jgi:hypothetical protein